MNNYDISSSGTNIEMVCIFDSFEARNTYRDNITKVNGDTFLSTNTGNATKAYDIPKSTKTIFKDFVNHFYAGNEQELGFEDIKFLINDLERYVDITPLKNCSPQTLCEGILNLMGNKRELDDFLESYYAAKFFSVVSRGYSQGDHEEVFITFEELEARNLPATEESAKSLSQAVDNLLWDAPLFVRITVDEKEFVLSDHIKDRYHYEERELIECAEKQLSQSDLTKHQQDLVINWLHSSLPASPVYAG